MRTITVITTFVVTIKADEDKDMKEIMEQLEVSSMDYQSEFEVEDSELKAYSVQDSR
jgi:hypothetical protein